MIRHALALTTVTALLASTRLADAYSPSSPAPWWLGLDVARSAPAAGVVALRTPAKGRVRIAGTTFMMGSTPSDIDDATALCRREVESPLCKGSHLETFLYEGLAHEVTLRSFFLDRTEVSVGDYRRCVTQSLCEKPGFSPNDPRFARAELPVTSISWDAAKAYCAFVGGRLPTEAEWELAARGEERRVFPWGDVYNEHLANHGKLSISEEKDTTDGFAFIAPVDAFYDGATPEGVLQLAGNVGEWVSDFFEMDPGGFGYGAKPVTNPKGPPSGLGHIVRGGSYASPAAWIRGATRSAALYPSSTIGFRCAYDG